MNKQKIFTFAVLGINLALMLALFLFVIVPNAFAASCFTDTEGHWAETYICWLFDNGISAGFPDGTFRPADYVNRAQMAVFLQQLSGNGTVPPVVNADMLDGQHAGELRVNYENVIIVAKSGGDFSSVQEAIDSITGAASDNPYLVWVAPGEYSEAVTMKPYVHLQGAGQEATIITSTSSNGSLPPTQATLVLASDISLSDLVIENSGVGNRNVALLASGDVTRTLVADVSVRAHGSGSYNYAIFLTGSGTDVKLQQLTALSENGSNENYGLYNFDGAAANLFGCSFTGRGGSHAYGINNSYPSTTLKATSVTALGEDGSSSNYGLYNFNGAVATLLGDFFTGRGGSNAYGIWNSHPDSILEAENVTTLGENSSTSNYGLINYYTAVATLHGGSFTGRGGSDAYGIFNDDFSTLETEGITSLGEDGSSVNYGLYNYYGAAATLHGGSFTGRGGINAYGIHHSISSSTLEATSITALGENGTSNDYSLYQDGGIVSLGVTQLVGAVINVSGTMNCFQVYDGSFSSITCP